MLTRSGCFPRLYAAASLKQLCRMDGVAREWSFPRLYAAASLKRAEGRAGRNPRGRGFPRLYAAASLKRLLSPGRALATTRFSAALCRGLIEAYRTPMPSAPPRRWFSAALCRGIIEAPAVRSFRPHGWWFSAALCRGLIEACNTTAQRPDDGPFSAALCRGLIEATATGGCRTSGAAVFRGFMPRPH